MSVIESTFIKWLLGIAASLSVIIIAGSFSFYVSAEKFKSTDEAEDKAFTERINYIERMHNSDVGNINRTLEKMEQNQSDLLKTQKDILSKLPNQ